MSLIISSLPSGAHVTVFFCLPDVTVLVDATGANEGCAGGGVAVAGESLRPFAIDLSASSNGFIEEGCAMFGSGSFLTGAGGAFLKLGNFGLGFGAEKKEESDFASFTSLTTFLASFFTTTGFPDEGPAVDSAVFFIGGAVFDDEASAFRFLPFVSGAYD